METQASEAVESDLAAGRRFLWVAAVGALLTWLTLEQRGTLGSTLFLCGWVASVGAGIAGAQRVGRARGLAFAARAGLFVLCLVPAVNVIALVILWHLSRATRAETEAGALHAAAAARERARERANERASERARERTPARTAAASAATTLPDRPLPAANGTRAAGDSAARNRVLQAIPRIRAVDNNFKDGERVTLKYNLPPGAPAIDMAQADLPVTRAAQGIFGLNYMVDEGSQYTTLSEGELKASGMTLDELHQVAMANLRKRVATANPGLRLLRMKGPDGKGQAEGIMVLLDGDNEAALVLLDELWDKTLREHIPNGVMVAIPARDVCVFIDMNSVAKGGLGDLQGVISSIHRRQGHAFNGILHRQEGRWVLAGEVTGLEGRPQAT